jgi:hypothetical protein
MLPWEQKYISLPKQSGNSLMFMRLFFLLLFVFSLRGQTDKIWFNHQDSLIYFFEQQHIVKKTIDGSSVDSIFLDPIPEKYPDYEPAWINNKLHLGSKFGGLLYKVLPDTTLRIDYSFEHRKQSQAPQFVYNDTLFRYGGYGFWRANNFFTYFDNTTSEWEYYATHGVSLPPEAYNGVYQLVGNHFYVLGGHEINPNTGLHSAYIKELWRFDFSTRKWKNLGRSGFDPRQHIAIPKGDKMVFFNKNPEQSLSAVVDFPSNRIDYYKSNLINLSTNQIYHPFFLGDILYSLKENRIQKATFQKDFFTTPIKSERIYFDANGLFLYLTYFVLVLFAVIISVFIVINYRKRQAPTLVRGGIRCQGVFYALRPEEEAIIRFLYNKKQATNEEILSQIANAQLSYSQNSKRKSDAILAINKITNQLSNKPLIVQKKSPKDKRQTIYFFNPNILQQS